MLLTARNLSKSFSLRPLFSGVSLSIEAGDRLGVIGPNGAGKSTLLKVLAGLAPADEGGVTASKSLRAVYVPQQDEFASDATAREVVLAAAFERLNAPGAARDGHEAEGVADNILDRLSFDGDHLDASASALSGGWRKRLSLARALASCAGEPDLILLDEPTNHLDLDAIRWLESLLRRGVFGSTPFASVFVTHDRAFLESVATRVGELSPAYPQGLFCVEGNYSEFVRRKEEFLEGQAKAQQVMANQVRKDQAWLGRGPQGRGTKAKGRIQASHARMDELSEIRARNTAAGSAGARVDFNPTDRRTRKLIAARGVSKSLGGRCLFSGVDVTLGVGDCLGLLGPNGSGKTTLIRVLTGELDPDTGVVVRSEPAPRVAVFSQQRRDFAPTTTLKEALCPVSDQVRFRGQPMHVTSWARRFLFRDEQLAQPVGSLSGGEVARIHIARIMLEAADVLVLDEPTNDLDIPTLETLEEAMEDFPGALVLVTHDRAMLGRLATGILALDGRGNARAFAGLDQALAVQRAEPPVSTTRESRSAQATGPPTAPNAARRKLSYNEQRDYDGIEERIRAAEARAAEAERAMNRPGVVSDRARMAAACEALSRAQAEVVALYKRWEELEAKVAP